MRGTFVALLAALAIGCSATVSPPAPTGSGSGSAFEPPLDAQQAIVSNVVDGDTIRVDIGSDNVAVRYIGLDAPEVGSEPLADESTDANRELVDGREVMLERDTSDTDQFGRLLRHVWLATDDGWLNVNAQIVRLGLADARTYQPDTTWDAFYSAAEQEAREAGIGIWGLEGN